MANIPLKFRLKAVLLVTKITPRFSEAVKVTLVMKLMVHKKGGKEFYIKI